MDKKSTLDTLHSDMFLNFFSFFLSQSTHYIPSSSIEPSSITFNYKLLKPYLLYPEDELLHRRESLFVKRFSLRTIQSALYPEILKYFKSLYASLMISPVIEAVSESFEAAPVSFKSLTGLTLNKLSISQEIIETLKKLQSLTKLGLSRFEFDGDL
jgi:hypothetical protein